MSRLTIIFLAAAALAATAPAALAQIPEPNFAGERRRRRAPARSTSTTRSRRASTRSRAGPAPDVRALSRRLPADALLLRPDRRQAGPERRPDRPGDDREADAGRLHHPLQAEPRARRRHGAAGRAGPPAPRHLAVGAATTAAARSSPPARRRRSRPFPRGYGMPIKATDQWLLLYMVHSAVSQPMETYITYDDRLRPEGRRRGARDEARLPGLARRAARPATRSSTSSASFGGADGTCTWPTRAVRRVRPVRQAVRRPGRARQRHRRGPRAARRRRAARPRSRTSQGGTLIGIGGHLHPGGLTNDDRPRPARRRDVTRASAVASASSARAGRPQRQAQAQAARKIARNVRPSSDRIYTGGPVLGPRGQDQGGGPPTSWDFSMRGHRACRTGACASKPGDILRSNATYDTTIQSTYENMGIAVALLAPDTPDGKPTGARASTRSRPQARRLAWTASPAACRAGRRRSATRARSTHGHYAENDNYGGPGGTWDATTRPADRTRSAIADFLYAPGDLSTMSMTGVPTVKLGSNAALHEPRGRGDLPHGHVVRVPVPRARPARRSRSPTARRARAASSTSTRPSSASASPAIGAAKQALRLELPVTAGGRASSPARSSPTSAASTRACAARSR